MITNIYDIDNIRKVYSYLEYTTLSTRAEKALLNIAAERVRNGQPLSPQMEKDVHRLFALYNGMTVE